MKRWTEDEIKNAIYLHENNFNFYEIGEKLNRNAKSIREKLRDYNIKDIKVSIPIIIKNCQYCNEEFESPTVENRKFCSQTCSAKYNNSQLVRITNSNQPLKYGKKAEHPEITPNKCLNCDVNIERARKFCSHKCEKTYKKNEIFTKIENNDTSLDSRNYKTYLIYKFGEKCMECGWNKKNLFSNKIPIELEHIDGNSDNNSLSNLKLLCPNCHSLTPTYKSLNTGNGRHKRMKRYKEGKSY
jgi:hypothetical protein